MTVEELVEAQKHEAKLHVIRAMMVRKIFEQEGPQLTNEDLTAELLKMAREYGMSPDEMFKALKKADAMEELRFRAVYEKVLAFLRENAEILEIAEGQPAEGLER